MKEEFGFKSTQKRPEKSPEIIKLETTLCSRFVDSTDEPNPQHIGRAVFIDASGCNYAGIYRGLIRGRGELVLFPSLRTEYMPGHHDLVYMRGNVIDILGKVRDHSQYHLA